MAFHRRRGTFVGPVSLPPPAPTSGFLNSSWQGSDLFLGRTPLMIAAELAYAPKCLQISLACRCLCSRTLHCSSVMYITTLSLPYHAFHCRVCLNTLDVLMPAVVSMA